MKRTLAGINPQVKQYRNAFKAVESTLISERTCEFASRKEMVTRNKPTPKRVVYLWGAGATHAEAQYLGAPVSLLMGGTNGFGGVIASRTLQRMGDGIFTSFDSDQGLDIESDQLICR